MKTILEYCRYVGTTLAFLLLIGLQTGSTTTAPDNVEVYLREYDRTYIAPPCMTTEEHEAFIARSESLQLSTIKQARDAGYKPDTDCVNSSGFVQDGRSLTGKLFEKIGILDPLTNRWNDDGSWNW